MAGVCGTRPVTVLLRSVSLCVCCDVRSSYIVNSYADSANLTTMAQYNDGEVKAFQSFAGPGLFKVRRLNFAF